MEIVDLTLPLRPGPGGYPDDPPVEFARVCSHETCGYEVTRISLGSHSGTHLDAPRHFFPSGLTLDQYSVARLVQPGVVIDCRPVLGQRAVGETLLAERLQSCVVRSGGFVLLWTEGAWLSEDGARMLLAAGAGLVGTDAPSLDEEPHPVHRLLLGNGVLLAENLSGLDRLGPGPVMCAFLPLAVAGTDGAPVRAIAWR